MSDFVVKELIEKLERLQQVDVYIAGGCDCCGSWIQREDVKDGEFVKAYEIEALIENLKSKLS